MNKFVANLYSNILSMMHIAVILSLSYFVYAVYHDPYQLAQYGISPSLYGYDPSASIWIALGLFVAYVILAGILSTFVAIYDRLTEISRKLDKS